MMMTPQNPYDSYIIEASAGAGKTYQLTRRFLNIVGAGTSASKILTITFTVKAALEMKERIIQDAYELLYKPKRQLEFEQELSQYYKDYVKKTPHSVPKPRSARETAEDILSSTQLLRITTIDALFYDWFASFPWEANPFPQSMNTRSLPYEMMDSLEIDEVNKNAWDQVFSKQSAETLKHCLQLIDSDSEQGVLGIEQKIYELFRHYTFLWQTEQETGEALLPYSIEKDYSEADFFKDLREDLHCIFSELNKREQLLNLLERQDISALFEERIFNQEGQLSGLYIRGKNREKLAREISRVDEAMSVYLRVDKLKKLNSATDSFFQLYKFWIQERESIKQKKGLVEFHDLAIGNYKLFHEPIGMGASWFLQKSFQHLMIDECQDTSFLQFSVFRKMIEEILSFQAEVLPQTVFLVGDKKQSIYGFREAEPEVLNHMKDMFHQFEKTCIPLHKSYRSAPVILNFVNEVFRKNIAPDFPMHESDETQCPQKGHVVVQELKVDSKDRETSLKEEADYLANYLKKALSEPESHPVYEKKTGTYRPLKASDCVILYRSSTHLEYFEEALRRENIPFLREEKKGLFSEREIKDVLALFRFLCDPRDMISLLTFLRSPFADISDTEILQALESTLKEERRELALLEIFKEKPFYPHLSLWKKNLHTLAPSELFLLIIEGIKIPKGNLLKLYEILLSIENENKPTLRAVLHELELRKEQDSDASISLEGEAIRLMTIHKSKGLEFPFVTVIKCSEVWYRLDRYWAKVHQDGQRGLAFIGTQRQRPKKEKQLERILSSTERALREESERLLYVALTRASQYLLLTAHQNKSLSDSFYPFFLNRTP